MKRKPPRVTPIRTTATHRAVVRGWLQGRQTYLWLGARTGDREDIIGLLDGQSLYRLAKAIVRHFEADPQPKARRRPRS